MDNVANGATWRRRESNWQITGKRGCYTQHRLQATITAVSTEQLGCTQDPAFLTQHYSGDVYIYGETEVDFCYYS